LRFFFSSTIVQESVFPTLEGLLAAFLHFLFGLAHQFDVRFDVMLYAQQHHIVRIVAETLHLGLGLGRLEGDQVVMVNALAPPPGALKEKIAYLATILLSVADAPLAQTLCPCVHDGLGRCPPLVVEHLHVFGSVAAAAHIANLLG